MLILDSDCWETAILRVVCLSSLIGSEFETNDFSSNRIRDDQSDAAEKKFISEYDGHC